MIMNNNQAENPIFQQTTRFQCPVFMAMISDFSKGHPSYPGTPEFHQQPHAMPKQIIASSPNIAGHSSNEHHGRPFLVDLSDPNL